MDRHNDWPESEDCHFFDARCTSDNEWNADTMPREDHAASDERPDDAASDLSAVARSAKADARPSAGECRIMVIGFSVIRV